MVGKPEVIQLDEKSPMLRLARPALQRLLSPGRHVAGNPEKANRLPALRNIGKHYGVRIYLHLLRRRALDTTIGFTEPGVSILGLSRPRTANSLGLCLW